MDHGHSEPIDPGLEAGSGTLLDLLDHLTEQLDPLVDGQALLTAVASASKVAANTLTLEDGVLKVPEEDAQAVRAAVAALRKAGYMTIDSSGNRDA